MNWDDNLGDTSIDEVFNFNTQAQGSKNKRSSILKQTKKTNVEMFENEETDNRRNRQSMKRVSFAETFQVKELNTGNIYDIPGWNESSQRSSHSVQISHSVANNSEGTFLSRSFVSESSGVTSQDPAEKFTNTNLSLLNDQAPGNMELCGRDPYAFSAVPEKTGIKVQQPKTIQAPSKPSKSVVTLLEGNPKIEDKENIYLPDKPYKFPWMGSDYLKENSNISDDFDFLKESLFKGGSQEYKSSSENSGTLPFESGNTKAPQKSVKTSQKSDRHLNVDVLNKENVLQTSPKFSNLKFIDSPPSWKSVDENILKSPNAVLPGKEIENKPIGKLLFVSKNKDSKAKENASIQNQNRRVDIYSEVDKENMLPIMTARTQNPQFAHEEYLTLPSETGNNFEFNRTRSNVSAMDLALLPENFDEYDASVELEDIPISNERTQNRTRFSICDMDMTCAFDQSASEDSLSVSSSKRDKLDILGKSDFIDTNSAKESVASIRCSQQSNAPNGSEEDFPPSRYTGNERTQNRTRFSTYDMEITCVYDQSVAKDSMSVSPQRHDKFSVSGELGIPGAPDKISLMHPEVYEFDKSLKNLQRSMLPETLNHIADVPIEPGKDLPLSRCVVNERTQNKTRFSTCDMEMTCAFDQSVAEDSSSDNPGVSGESRLVDVQDKNLKVFEAMESNASLRSLQPLNPRNQMLPEMLNKIANVDLEEDFPSRCGNLEKKQNKTRFSTCDMEMTCTFNLSVAENSISVSPPITNKLGDFGKSNFVRTSEKNILKRFEVTDLDEKLKSSQQSNFSFEEIERIPSSNFSNVVCPGDVKKYYNSPMLLKDCESLPFENKINCFEGNTNSKVLEENMLNRMEQNIDPKVDAPGRKYLKFSYEAENFNDRLQTSSPADLESSFMLKNKENLHSNRKRIIHFPNKPTRMPLGFRTEGMDVDSLAETCGKSFPEAASIPKACYSEDSFSPSCRPDVPSVGQRTILFRSELMELTCHNLSLQESDEDISNSIIKKVKVVTETEITSPRNVFPSSKQYENTRYSTNYMDITCLPESCDSSKVLDEFQTADSPKLDSPKEEHQVPPYFHLKKFPMADRNHINSMNQSVRARQKMFKVVTEDFSSSMPSSSRQEIVHNSYFNDKDNSFSAGLSKDSPVKDCQAADVVCSDSCVEVNTVQESSKREMLPCPKAVKKNCANFNSEGIKAPSTPGIVYTMRRIKQSLKEANGNIFLFPELSKALKKRQKFSFKHPYTEMKITSPVVKDCRQNQSFEPESQENSFTCLSREGSRPPSLLGLSSHHQTNSEVSVVSRNAEVKSLCQEIENLSVLVSSPEKHLPKVHLSMGSPERKHSRTLSNLNSSEALPEGVNEPEVFHSEASPKTQQSLSVPKNNYSMVSPDKPLGRGNHSVSYGQMPSITFDDSFQLLHHSALENSLMDSYSKKFTICLDRSDFVPKESIPISPPKVTVQNMDGSAFECNSMMQNESVFRLSPKMLREDSIALPIAGEATISRKIPFAFPETNKNTSTNQTQLDLSHKHEKTLDSSSREVQHETLKDNSYFAAKLRANALLFQTLLKSSPVSESKGHSSVEKSKLSVNDVPDEISQPQLPTHSQNEKVSIDQDDAVNCLGEKIAPSAKNRAESSHEDFKMVLKAGFFASDRVDETPLAHKATMIPDFLDNELMDTESEAESNSAQKWNNLDPATDVSVIPDTQSQESEEAKVFHRPDAEFFYSSQDMVKDRSRELFTHVNEDVSMSEAAEPVDHKKNNGESSNNCSSRVPVLKDTLSIFEKKFEEAFSCKRRNWILKSLTEGAATFQLQWAAYVYGCMLRVEVAHLNASECSISFTPIGKSVVVGKVDGFLGDVQERGYEYFEYLVKDKVLPFPIFSDEMIAKFTEYAQIANDVEGLMRDLMQLALSGICDHPRDLEPVSVTIEANNNYYEQIHDMTFRVDLKTYPRAKIVPEVKHQISSGLNGKDIMNDIFIACANVEPGENYLYRMVEAANELKP